MHFFDRFFGLLRQVLSAANRRSAKATYLCELGIACELRQQGVGR